MRSEYRRALEKVQHIIDAHQESAPVPVVSLAKALGLSVYTLDTFPDDLSGMIKKEEDESYGIYVNSKHHPNRRRFTIAHEVGHFILHKKYIGDGIVDDALYRSGLGSIMETEANTFAAELLMPFHLLSRESSPDKSIKDMAAIFEVSEAAMGIRLGEPAYSIGAVA